MKRHQNVEMHAAKVRVPQVTTCVASAFAVLLAGTPALATDATDKPENGSIAYALVAMHWATYQTPDGKEECPAGLNQLGPREQFKVLFPENEPRKLLDTQLKYEVDTWFPTTSPNQFPFSEVTGSKGYGLNLDGKVDANDLTSPDGEKGIDNQFYRVLGCIPQYRGPDGPSYYYDSLHITRNNYNRILIDITGVDSLTNDDDVTVTFYRGLDRLLTDATGEKILAGGSQRLDLVAGHRYVYALKGKIVDGVLTTEAKDVTFPWATFQTAVDVNMRDLRMQVKLAPTKADGLIGGYINVEKWYRNKARSTGTHYQSYGQLAMHSLYRSMKRLADAYPDPVSGENTAISTALQAEFTQVHIVRNPPNQGEKSIGPIALLKDRQ